jgi:SpoVK/Ycf46/Vps4 family AAA+-type ATPase
MSDILDLTFSDIAGMDKYKRTLTHRIAGPLAEPEKHSEYGLSIDNGFLLHGPPGTGKAYLSKALAGELGINYIEAKGADIISQYVGASANRVAELFAQARANEPCLVFIDEIDALAPERGGDEPA